MTLTLMYRALKVIRGQRTIIDFQDIRIQQLKDELAAAHLEYNREIRALVCSWLISLEKPEIDMREDLVQLDTKLAYSIAELEEHVV